MSISTSTQSSSRVKFSIANHIGHGLGLLLCAFNVLAGLSPDGRSGGGYAGNVWIAYVVFGGIGAVALIASWITKASAPRRIGGVSLVVVGVASLGLVFEPDLGAVGLIATAVGALLQFGAAALILLPKRQSS